MYEHQTREFDIQYRPCHTNEALLPQNIYSVKLSYRKLISLYRIEKLYLSLFCSRRKQVHPFHFMSSSLLNSIELAALFTTHSHFAGLIRLFSCGNKRFVVFEVLKLLALLRHQSICKERSKISLLMCKKNTL